LQRLRYLLHKKEKSLWAHVFQLLYYAAAAEALSSAQGEIEELSVAAEGEYR